jgi:Prealbumin-like fold domain
MPITRSRRRLPRRLAIPIAAALVVSLVLAYAGFANLPGSTFEGNDGNLVVNTAGNTDWVNAPNRVRGDDLASGRTDNSFGQGTKEDDANVTVVTGSIPPNKSDLTRFYVASEFATNSNFLYLAWERSNVLGSANMDFEINKLAQPNLTTTGPKTLNRSPGDLLVTYDFGGSGTPTLGLLIWLTAANGAATDCFSANTLPCWGAPPIQDALDGVNDNRIDLSDAGFAEGAVNEVTVTDPIAGVSLPANTFGEAAINLTAAGVFPAGTCVAFGSAFLKSRSAASFPSEVKDFVAPQPINISNCGTINIIKHTDPRGIDQDFSYTSTIPSSPSTCTLDTTPSDFTLNDDAGVDPTSPITAGTANTEHCANVPAGTYTVTEGADPANFAFASLTCTASGGSSFTTSGRTATITVAPDGTVTYIYTNQLQTGAIKVTKTRKHAADGSGDHPHAGVSFTVDGVTKQTDANGVACFDGLLFGTYSVHETVPAGYHVDGNDKQVTVDNTAACSDDPYGGESVSFHNTPLTDITVSVNSQVDGGTASTIECTDGTNTVASGSTGANGDGSATAPDLEPGTYTCTVVVDP